MTAGVWQFRRIISDPERMLRPHDFARLVLDVVER
jgi:hypothetical protein